ncbi:MAG TPA: hypothetical protein VN759_02600, partial [Pseudolysinimonas sp.]|nr:hypothetical protein [Pseudolysinimonas sp.]
MGTATSWRLAAVFGVLLLVIAAGVVFSGATRRSGPAAGAVAVTAGSDRCSGWGAPHPGPVMFRVTNTANQSLDIYLQDPRTGRVFGEVEGIGTAARADLRVVLGNGRYRFVCLA